MAGPTTVDHVRNAKELPRNRTLRGRAQQRKARGRCFSSGVCPAVSAVDGFVDNYHHANATTEATTDCSIVSSEGVWIGHMPTPAESMIYNAPTDVQVMKSSDSHELQDQPSLLTLAKDQEYCNTIVEKLDSMNAAERHTLLLQVFKFTRQLALSRTGCRIVQKAFEVAGGSDRDAMIAELKDHIIELYESPHGNHVLSKTIEVLPSSKSSFIISALRGRGIAAAKHRFGCRVMCRLIEHCGEEHLHDLLDEVLADAFTLSQHAFGNFIIQTALEHGSHARRSATVMQLLPGFATLCKHRAGSLVAQRVLSYCDENCQSAAIYALLQGENDNSLIEVACNRFGSYVIEQLAGMNLGAVGQVAHIIGCNLEYLQISEHAPRVIVAFGFAPAELLDIDPSA